MTTIDQKWPHRIVNVKIILLHEMEVGWSRPDDRNAHGALIWQHPGVIIKSKSLEHKWYFLIYSLLIGQLEYFLGSLRI